MWFIVTVKAKIERTESLDFPHNKLVSNFTYVFENSNPNKQGIFVHISLKIQ